MAPKWLAMLATLSSMFFSCTPAVAIESGLAYYDLNVASKRPLGLQLSSLLTVTGFARDSPKEVTSVVRTGDVIVAVNDDTVTGMALSDVARRILQASVPKTLRFARTQGPKEPSRAHNADSVSDGAVELSSQGIPIANLRYAYASFGARGRHNHCRGGRMMAASPPQGCSAYPSRSGARLSVAVVIRGDCAFYLKALQAEAAGAIALIVINGDEEGEDEILRMPGDPLSKDDVRIPVVMVSHRHGQQLLDRLKVAKTEGDGADLVARLREDGAICQSAPPLPQVSPRREPAVASTTTAGPSYSSRRLEATLRSSNGGGEMYAFSRRHGAKRSEKSAISTESNPDDGKRELEIRPVYELTAAQHRLQARHEASFFTEYLLAQTTSNESVDGLEVRLSFAVPADGCTPLVSDGPGAPSYQGSAVLVDRGGCSLGMKTQNVGDAGGFAVIVANNEPGLLRMAQARTEAVVDEKVPSVMVSERAGRELRRLIGNPETHVSIVMRGSADVELHWAELEIMRNDQTAWPDNEKATRRTYASYARRHHPDKQTGSLDRFEYLRLAYLAALRKIGAEASEKMTASEL